MKRWVNSYNENKPEKMAQFYEKSDKVELLVSMGRSFTGHKEIANMWKEDMGLVTFHNSKSFWCETDNN